MNRSDQLRELAGLKGSTGVALVAFLSTTTFNTLRALDSIMDTAIPGLIFAGFSVAIVQAMARLEGSVRDFALLALGSAGLLMLMVGTALFRSGSDTIDWLIVLAIWGGISLAALVLIVVYRRT